MEPNTINTENGRLIFFITYNVAFMIVLGLFIFCSLRKGNSLSVTVVTAASAVLFFILGMNLSSVSPEEIRDLFQGYGLRMHHEKNLLGGVIGLTAGIFLAERILRAGKGLTDDFAVGLPLGMAIHRLGCLFTGCCFGRPAALPWSVCYTEGSQAFHAHPGLSLPDTLIPCSLPVHPVQMYELILGLIVAVVVIKSVRKFRKPGSLFMFSIMLYAIIWFVCEFFRDSGGIYVAGKMVMGLRLIQWCLAASVLLSGIVLLIREKVFRRLHKLEFSDPVSYSSQETSLFSGENKNSKENLIRITSFTAILCFCFLLARACLDPMDKLIISFMLIPAILLNIRRIFLKIILPKYRIFYSLLIISSLLCMSQAYEPVNKGEKIKYTEIGFSGMWNGFSTSVQKAIKEYDDCGVKVFAYDPTEIHHHNAYDIGFRYSSNHVKSKYRQSAFYTNAFLGLDHETCPEKKFDKWNINIGANPGVRFDFRYFGLRAGLWLGYFKMAGITTIVKSVGDYSGDMMSLFVFPQVSLRFGPENICYLRVQLADVNPVTTAPVFLQGGIGTGFGKLNNYSLEAGFSSIGPYLSGQFPVGRNFFLNAYLSGECGMQIFNTYDNIYVSAGFTYRFDFKTVKRTR